MTGDFSQYGYPNQNLKTLIIFDVPQGIFRITVGAHKTGGGSLKGCVVEMGSSFALREKCLQKRNMHGVFQTLL
jgi:hypothetical protein